MAKKGARIQKSPNKAPKKASKTVTKKPSKTAAKKKQKKNAKTLRKKLKGKVYQFETLLELIELLQHINNECALKDKWKYHIFVFPCYLDDVCYFLSCQYGRVYIARNKIDKGLYRPLVRYILKKYYDRVPKLVLKDQFWAFNFVESLPLEKRNIPVTNPVEIEKVARVIEKYIEDLALKRETRKKLKESSGPPWTSCSICDPIPESVYAYWRGGELETGGIPATEQYLYVVGEPIFDDSDTYRHWCLKQCPECSTCYLWQFDYESFAGGSEDEVEIKRLSSEEEKEWKEKVFEAIRDSKEHFETNSQHYIEILQTKKQRKVVRKAVDYFYHEQLVNGHDITGAIPALVYALAHHQHVQRARFCPGHWIVSILGDYSRKKPENREILLETMKKFQDQVTSNGDEFQKLLNEIATSDFDAYDLF